MGKKGFERVTRVQDSHKQVLSKNKDKHVVPCSHHMLVLTSLHHNPADPHDLLGRVQVRIGEVRLMEKDTKVDNSEQLNRHLLFTRLVQMPMYVL
jgi:hypothetical protein